MKSFLRLPTGLVFLTALALIALFFWCSIIGYVDGPIVGEGDVAQYAFTGFYFGENISWLPVPHLSLNTNWTHYPYGANHVFLHWAFERDMFFAFLNGVFGAGPWLQIYFLLSLVLTAAGSFFILRTEWEEKLAATAGLVLGFCNFYAIRKFPAHMPHSILHWTVLGIVLDAVLMRKAVLRKNISPNLIMLRFALLFLSLGLELGYIAGFSLLSFSVTLFFLGVLSILRVLRASTPFRKTLRDFFSVQMNQLRLRPLSFSGVLLVALLALWLFVPLSAQIARTASSFGTPEPHFRRFENPLRVFLPFVPGFNPEMTDRDLFHDHGENWGYHFSPGLSFLLLALFGLISGRRRWPTVLPVLVVLLLCLFFHPARFPTLHFFPWFRFARVPGRATAVFPALLIMLALSAWPLQRPRRLKTVLAAVLMLLLVTESSVAARLMSGKRMSPSTVRLIRPDAAFWNLMSTIRQTPGEAIFEWPFALSFGEKLGIFNRRLKGINQLAQFHHKKVIGVHFGRPFACGLNAFIEAGWPHLFFPVGKPGGDGLRGFTSPFQRRDFVGSEWDFISRFFELNDFCGILLFPDLLPEETVRGFHARFGKTLASAEISPGPHRVEFIRKPSAMRIREDSAAGKSLHLLRPVFSLPLSRRLEFGEYAIEDLLGEGWARPRPGIRNTLSRRADIIFSTTRPEALKLKMALRSYGKQRIILRFNGENIRGVELDGGGLEQIDLVLPQKLLKNENTLSLGLPDARVVQERSQIVLKGIGISWMRADPVGTDE